jgi:hypothetical protein
MCSGLTNDLASLDARCDFVCNSGGCEKDFNV